MRKQASIPADVCQIEGVGVRHSFGSSGQKRFLWFLEQGKVRLSSRIPKHLRMAAGPVTS